MTVRLQTSSTILAIVFPNKPFFTVKEPFPDKIQELTRDNEFWTRYSSRASPPYRLFVCDLSEFIEDILGANSSLFSGASHAVLGALFTEPRRFTGFFGFSSNSAAEYKPFVGNRGSPQTAPQLLEFVLLIDGASHLSLKGKLLLISTAWLSMLRFKAGDGL